MTSTLLDIVGDDIALLGDGELRELIGRLCEADYQSAGLSTTGITWGGNQDAGDGGLDVVVRDTVSPPESSLIPRNITGFQVKKPDMPRAEILKEMRPHGVLRPSIKTLIERKGAYIIVSGNGSVTDTALQRRINAMKEAVANESNHEDLHLDFLDRGRVATWIRSYLSLIPWVRDKIDRPLKAWRPYANWSNAPGGLDEEYLLDDGLRLHGCENFADKGQSVENGLSKIREALETPGKSVRLVGLSGVGKTRVAQALFDSRIGQQALNPSRVVYADMSGNPEPDPVAFSDQLINSKSPTILIVDNCPPDLHRRLAQTCLKPDSMVSVLTIEYDVRDDIPEEKTDIFRLEPASDDLIEKLVINRFNHIGQVDARMIAKFSGGNARVAIALANTVKRGQTLSGFRDDELFKRLFWQRHDHNPSLLVSAQACALVYSFDGEDTTSESSELKFLGSLVEKSGQDIYRDVSVLKQRDLVQFRSKWRAVLPHAIANRLAKQALESIPKDTLISRLLEHPSKRLIRSFTRRLSYLHDSEIAKNIVEEWLRPEGWIGKSIDNLKEFDVDVLKNIAPVSPSAVLSTIERAANGRAGQVFTSQFVRLLHHLAYDQELFERSVKLICQFAAAEDTGEKNNFIRGVLKSLFYIHLSGTHATVEARAMIIQELLDSDDFVNQDIGLQLLDSALEATHFSTSQEFDFGARRRDYGYCPETRRDFVHWFSTFVDICVRSALSGKPIAVQAKKLLAKKLRGLWIDGGMYDEIEQAASSLLERGAWNDGWIAVREIIRHDSKGFDEETRTRLLALERRLKPKDLLEKARTFALSNQLWGLDLEDNFDANESVSASYRKTGETTRLVGAEVATEPEVFNKLLPDLVSTDNTNLHHFGQGLAEGCDDKYRMFQDLRDALENTPHEKRDINVLSGFLSSSAESDIEFYNKALDEAVGDDILGEWIPILQMSSTIDQRGVGRLHGSLDLGKAPIRFFKHITGGRVHESISDDDLAGLLDKILTKEDGNHVAVQILKMRFYRDKEESRQYSDNLIAVARKTLILHPFARRQGQQGSADYDLAQIAMECCYQSDGIATVRELAKNLADALLTYQVSFSDYPELLNVLARLHPRLFLDEFLGLENVKEYQYHWWSTDDFDRRKNPMSQIPDDTVIAWCDEDPVPRYAIVISAVKTFEKSSETGKYIWRPIVEAILDRAPDLEKIFQGLGRSLEPLSWSGSLVNILEERAILLQYLCEHDIAEVVSWARKQYAQLQQRIEGEKKSDINRNESFE